ncbi:MAG: BamA/TamA family outer membrane protein [Gemmatimonadota bacterium]
MPLRHLLIAVVVALTVPSGLQGQSACSAGEITEIFIDNHSIFDLDDLPVDRFRWAFEFANALHMRTRPSFIRRELLFGVGDCYDSFQISDSERILRRLPFISNAEVYGIRQPDGSWHVVVDTRDEWSTRLEVTVEYANGLDHRSIGLTEQNFLGRGFQISGFYVRNDANERLGGQFFTPQLFGTEADFLIGGGNTQVGRFWTVGVTQPFVGETGRWAGRTAASRSEDYFIYSSGTPDMPGNVLLPIEQRRSEFTGMIRFGEPGSLTSVGLGVARAELTPIDFPASLEVVENRDFGNPQPAPPEVVDEVARQTFFSSGFRINLLFGQRNIRFIQRTGLDALRGVADLQVGTDVSLTLGRTVGSGDTPDDLNTRLTVYAATAPSPFTLISRVGVEGRQVFFDPSTTRRGWRDVLARFDLLLYWQPDRFERHTVLTRVSASGGWTMDRPFQLTLGGRRGLRGFDEDDYPGARRVVLNLEDRIYLGWPAPNFADLGITLFGDFGRVFGGDVPFGFDSGWRGSVGAGLRIGFPAGTRGVARVDLAWPLGAGGGPPILRISLADLLGIRQGFEDPQFTRSQILRVGPDRFTPSR